MAACGIMIHLGYNYEISQLERYGLTQMCVPYCQLFGGYVLRFCYKS